MALYCLVGACSAITYAMHAHTQGEFALNLVVGLFLLVAWGAYVADFLFAVRYYVRN